MASNSVKKEESVVEETLSHSDESEAVLEEVKPNPITQARFQLEVEANTTWRASVPEGVTPENCLDEAYWAHMGQRMMIGDTVIVRPDTGEWELVLHVANCGREFAQMIKKSLYDLRHSGTSKTEQSRYSVDFAGTTHKWRFKRDGKVLKDGFATKGLASQAASNHQLAVDRSAK